MTTKLNWGFVEVHPAICNVPICQKYIAWQKKVDSTEDKNYHVKLGKLTAGIQEFWAISDF